MLICVVFDLILSCGVKVVSPCYSWVVMLISRMQGRKKTQTQITLKRNNKSDTLTAATLIWSGIAFYILCVVRIGSC